MKKRNHKLKVMITGALTIATLLAPLTGAIAEATTIKAKSNVNVRASSYNSAQKVGYAQAGDVAEYLGTENGWYKINLNGTVGYSFRTYWEGNTVTATSNVNVRASANNRAEKVAYAVAGTEAVVLGRDGSWLYIETGGIKGYSYKSYWDLSDTLFYSLPYTTGEADNTNPTPAPEVPSNPENIQAGDQYRVFTSVSGHLTAADAAAGTKSIRKVSAGTYYVFKEFSEMYNVSTVKGAPGAWINPANNSSNEPAPPSEPTPTPPTNPEPPVETQPENPSDPGKIEVGDAYKVLAEISGYYTAADASAGTNPMQTMTPGTYYVYKIFSGMINISTSKNSPGAWIDPATNDGTSSPAPKPENDPDSIGDKVIEVARTLLGAPYVFGGESWEEGGFDCSGLTQYSFNKVGIRIPRTASQQWAGISNKVSVPKPGDIIAFEKSGKIYHVGIFIGDNKMIHSPQPGDVVKIVDLDWHYKNNRVKGFLRPRN
ncbi:MAG: SH3 domain-containing protein [Clostridium sp.]|nr:SH3 domain-containing protein [Clostridium sp.]